MKKDTVVELVKDQLLPLWEKDQAAIKVIDRWYRTEQDPITTRRTNDKELKYLADISRTPWLALTIETVAQGLKCEGVHTATADDEELARVWRPWQINRLERRQGPLHRAALAYGLAYTLILPGDAGARITAFDPAQMLALYKDPADDDFPMYAIRVIPQPKGATQYRVYDEESEYFLAQESTGGAMQFIEGRAHKVGYVPVVRYANRLDLQGRAPGEIEPLIPLAKRINKTDYDRMLTQHFNSWKVRTATGLDEPGTPEDREKQKMTLAQRDIMTGGEGVTFGTLDETNLKPFIEAHDSDIESLAALSQTPTTTYGKLINVSAEGLVEAKASLRAKTGDRQTTFGASHMDTLRVAADVEGRADDALNFALQPKWAEFSDQTMSQAVDALGKAAQMLNVPPEVLWERIPGVDLTTVKGWLAHAKDNPSPERIQAEAVARQLMPTVPTDPAAPVMAPAAA